MSLNNLPIDISYIILINLSDLDSLRGCILSCKRFYAAYVARERLILSHVLYEELGPELFAVATDVQLANLVSDNSLSSITAFTDASHNRRERMKEDKWLPQQMTTGDTGNISLPSEMAKTHAEILKLSAASIELMETYGAHYECSEKFTAMMQLPEPRRTKMIYKCYYLWFLMQRLCDNRSATTHEYDRATSEKLNFFAYRKIWNWRCGPNDEDTHSSIYIGPIVANEVRFLWGILGSPEMRPPENFFSVSGWAEFHLSESVYDKDKQKFINRPEEELAKRRMGKLNAKDTEYHGSALFHHTWAKILDSVWTQPLVISD